TAAVNLTIDGASLDLLILSGTKKYALIAGGGTDALTGIPALSVSASGLTVMVNNTGIDPTTLAGLPGSITTADGSQAVSFSGLGSDDVISVEGTIDFNIAGFLSIHGDFSFQTFTDTNNSQDIIIAAQDVSATLGTASTYLSIDGASLQAV